MHVVRGLGVLVVSSNSPKEKKLLIHIVIYGRPRILLTINSKSTGCMDVLRIICQGYLIFIHALL